jgi:hypothetical protein
MLTGLRVLTSVCRAHQTRRPSGLRPLNWPTESKCIFGLCSTHCSCCLCCHQPTSRLGTAGQRLLAITDCSQGDMIIAFSLFPLSRLFPTILTRPRLPFARFYPNPLCHPLALCLSVSCFFTVPPNASRTALTRLSQDQRAEPTASQANKRPVSTSGSLLFWRRHRKHRYFSESPSCQRLQLWSVPEFSWSSTHRHPERIPACHFRWRWFFKL